MPAGLMSGSATTDLPACLHLRWRDLERAAIPSVVQANLPDPVFWDELEQVAEEEGVRPVLYAALRGRVLSGQAIGQGLRGAYLHAAARNRIWLRELDAALQALAAAGIPVIVLKGAALASAVYADPALRPMTDLDLLIQSEQVPAATAALLAAGYSPPLPGHCPLADRLASNSEMVLCQRDPPYTLLELHWHLFDSPHYRRAVDVAWFWQTALAGQIAGRAGLILGPEAQILHLCGHLALHHEGEQPGGYPSPKLLWHVDVGEVIHRYGEQMDWALVLEKAQAYDLILSLQLVLGRVDALWPGRVPAGPLTQLRNLTASPVERRVFALLTARHRPTAQRLYTDLIGLPDWRARVDHAVRSLFPAPAYMTSRYAIPQRWLLPAYYPYRWWMGLSGLRRKQ